MGDMTTDENAVSAGTDRSVGDVCIDVLVIGAGQAGLGTGYWLGKEPGLSFLLVDGAEGVGDSWRRRWDSLQLFTPRRFSSLPGTPMPQGRSEYANKDEIGDYLTAFAAGQGLPVRLGTRVLHVDQDSSGGFIAETTTGSIRARYVVIASGPYSAPFIPAAADGLDPSVVQLHSSAYERPGDLPESHVLVVGAGNSAAQLAVELAASRPVTVAAPGGMWFLPSRLLGLSLYWWLWITRILNGRSGSRVSRTVRARGDGIIGKELLTLVATGRMRIIKERVCSANGNEVELSDGTHVRTEAVLWCTGYQPDYSWLRVSKALDEGGHPIHDNGRSAVPGLHWVGLPWQTRLNSGIIDGVDRDARRAVCRVKAAHARRGDAAASSNRPLRNPKVPDRPTR